MNSTIQCPRCRGALAVSSFQTPQTSCPRCGQVVIVSGQPAANQSAAQPSGGVPIVVWILGGIGATMLVGFLMCVGFMGYSVHLAVESAGKVDPELEGKTLLEARAGHQPQFTAEVRDEQPPELPPADLFRLEEYATDIGPMPAYVGVAGGEGPHPAIIWIFGGFSNGIGSTAW